MTDEAIAAARADIEATGDLLERELFAEQDAECVASARQMMAAALKDADIDWAEAAIGRQEKRLQQAFGGRRVPTYSS